MDDLLDDVEEHDRIDNKTGDSSSSIGSFSEFKVEAADSPVSVNSEFASGSGNMSDFNETLENDDQNTDDHDRRESQHDSN